MTREYYITLVLGLLASIVSSTAAAVITAFALLTIYIYKGFQSWLEKVNFKNPEVPALKAEITEMRNEIKDLRAEISLVRSIPNRTLR